jgi:hypothetical protein
MGMNESYGDSSRSLSNNDQSLYFLVIVGGGAGGVGGATGGVFTEGQLIFEAAELGINLERIFLPIFAKKICLPASVPTVTKIQA